MQRFLDDPGRGYAWERGEFMRNLFEGSSFESPESHTDESDFQDRLSYRACLWESYYDDLPMYPGNY